MFALRSAGLVWKAVSGSGERMLIGAASSETFLHSLASSFPYRFSIELTGVPPKVGATSLLCAGIFNAQIRPDELQLTTTDGLAGEPMNSPWHPG